MKRREKKQDVVQRWVGNTVQGKAFKEELPKDGKNTKRRTKRREQERASDQWASEREGDTVWIRKVEKKTKNKKEVTVAVEFAAQSKSWEKICGRR